MLVRNHLSDTEQNIAHQKIILNYFKIVQNVLNAPNKIYKSKINVTQSLLP